MGTFCCVFWKSSCTVPERFWMELDDTDAGLPIFVAFSDLSSIVQLLSGIDSRRNAHHRGVCFEGGVFELGHRVYASCRDPIQGGLRRESDIYVMIRRLDDISG